MNIKKLTKEICEAHGLDFEIQMEALTGIDSKRSTPYFGLYNSKTNDCINTVKKGYHVSQNADIVGLVLQGMSKFTDKLKVGKAGSLHDGRKVFVQLEIEGMSKVGKDLIKRYVTIVDSNDGSTGLSVGIGDLTMSCTNQFFKFYKRGMAKWRHTATLEEKIKGLPTLIEVALEESFNQLKVYRKFVSTPLTQNLADALVKELLGHDRVFTSKSEYNKLPTKSINHMDNLYDMIDLEIADKGENLWGLHSGVTRWTTHVKSAPKRNNGLEETLMTGTSYNKAIESFDFCVNKAGIIVPNNKKLELV